MSSEKKSKLHAEHNPPFEKQIRKPGLSKNSAPGTAASPPLSIRRPFLAPARGLRKNSAAHCQNVPYQAEASETQLHIAPSAFVSAVDSIQDQASSCFSQEEEPANNNVLMASVVDESAMRDEIAREVRQELLAGTVSAEVVEEQTTPDSKRCVCCPYGCYQTAVAPSFGALGYMLSSVAATFLATCGDEEFCSDEEDLSWTLGMVMAYIGLGGGALVTIVNLVFCCKVFSPKIAWLVVFAYSTLSVTSLLVLVAKRSSACEDFDCVALATNLSIGASVSFAGAAVAMAFLTRKGAQL